MVTSYPSTQSSNHLNTENITSRLAPWPRIFPFFLFVCFVGAGGGGEHCKTGKLTGKISNFKNSLSAQNDQVLFSVFYAVAYST